jgi:hypothetical protein
VKFNVRLCLIALLIAQFASLQWFAAVHRAAHASLPTRSLALLATSASENSHFKADERAFSVGNDPWQHQSKIDCDRFDACVGSDLVVARLPAFTLPTPHAAQFSRADTARITLKIARAKARAPPVNVA